MLLLIYRAIINLKFQVIFIRALSQVQSQLNWPPIGQLLGESRWSNVCK